MMSQDYRTMTFGQRLKLARKARGWSQERLSDKANIHVSTLRSYEGDHIVPTIFIAADLAQMLKVSLDWLVTGQEWANNSNNMEEKK